MKEFIEKLIGRLEEELESTREIQTIECNGNDGYGTPLQAKLSGEICALLKAKEIVNQLAEEYKDKVIIDGQYCWQSCSATEHCKECNRLGNGSIDYYENYDVLAEEYNGGWISVSEGFPKDIIKDCLVTLESGAVFQASYSGISHEFRMICWHGLEYFSDENKVIAWKPLPEPYQPKGE